MLLALDGATETAMNPHPMSHPAQRWARGRGFQDLFAIALVIAQSQLEGYTVTPTWSGTSLAHQSHLLERWWQKQWQLEQTLVTQTLGTCGNEAQALQAVDVFDQPLDPQMAATGHQGHLAKGVRFEDSMPAKGVQLQGMLSSRALF